MHKPKRKAGKLRLIAAPRDLEFDLAELAFAIDQVKEAAEGSVIELSEDQKAKATDLSCLTVADLDYHLFVHNGTHINNVRDYVEGMRTAMANVEYHLAHLERAHRYNGYQIHKLAKGKKP